jgi:hypothetical protein
MDLLEYHEARGVRVGRTPTEAAEIAGSLAR